MKTKCPKCGCQFTASENTDYDESDPIQKRGFDDQSWNSEHPFPLPVGAKYRNNPFADKSSEYYRWNRGARYRMDM